MIGYSPHIGGSRDYLSSIQDRLGFSQSQRVESTQLQPRSMVFTQSQRVPAGYSQASHRARSVISEPLFVEEESGRDYDQEADFTQSMSETLVRKRSDTKESLVQSLPLSNSGMSYKVYKPAQQDPPKEATENDMTRAFYSSLNYGHNINNPDRRRNRTSSDSSNGLKQQHINQLNRLRKLEKEQEEKKAKAKDGKRKSKRQASYHCNCGKYHSHLFPASHTRCLSDTFVMVETEKPKRSAEVEAAHENQTTICNIFWKAALTFSPYMHGDKVVEFTSLWPAEKTLKEELRFGIEETGIRDAMWELCLTALVSGPLYILKSLLELEFIRVDYQFENEPGLPHLAYVLSNTLVAIELLTQSGVDYQFENDPGLLHLACVLSNMEAIQLLTQNGISSKLRDRSGKTAGEVCFSPKTRKHLPTKYQPSILADRNKAHVQLKPGLHDKDTLFKLAANPRHFYDIQKKLQIFDFNVNSESNEDGDFLLHVACKAGICQLPLIMSLMKLHGANIEMCNDSGMTPLMIAAQDGISNLCDILMCLFGANPNKQNERNGKTALHYAIQANHVSVVNCLIKRGADVNIDDKELCRPDDLSPFTLGGEDCKQIILLHRAQRSEALSDMIKEDVVYPIDLRATDMRVVDEDGDTLVMTAAAYDRIHNLETLLGVSVDTIDAQNCKTGLTALAMAAKFGRQQSVKILLRFGANPNIPDMKGYLPLHQAVLKSHESTIEAFLDVFPTAYVGLHTALRLCAKSTIHDKLTVAWERRQREIIIPQLRMCALDGDAEKLFNILENGDSVNCKSDLNEELALFVAVENSHLEVVKLMVEKGADLRKRDVRTGNTVLHIVAKTGNLAVAKYVIDFCQPQTGKVKPRLDVNAVNNDRKTALQIAAEKGYIRLITLLMNHGATTALLNSQGSLFTSPEFEGARVQLETHRLRHTKEIMKLVSSKSKKAPAMLAKLFLPRFDHNLRDKNGDTPLMVACRQGRLQIVQFLLQSAVYANLLPGEDMPDNNSEADSGVPEITPWKSKDEQAIAMNAEELMRSGEEHDNLPLGASWDGARSLNPSALQNTIHHGDREGHGMGSFLTDVERPKGMYIYHDGIVSHVCAVNLFDGNSPLHHAIEGADNPAISHALLAADTAVINMQNDAGLTPLHLACKLGRKKVLQQLLTVEGLDLNLFTLTGHLPEEMTSNKSIIGMVKKVRQEQPERPAVKNRHEGVVRGTSVLSESLPSNISSHVASTINFDWIQSVYQSMKQTGRSKQQSPLGGDTAERNALSPPGGSEATSKLKPGLGGAAASMSKLPEGTMLSRPPEGSMVSRQPEGSTVAGRSGLEPDYSLLVSTIRPVSPHSVAGREYEPSIKQTR